MLEAVQLCKRYRRRTVLDGVNFSLAPGQVLGVAGHNGSGKSTLLSIAAQLLAPDGGQILYNGRSVLGDRAFMREMVGYVPQRIGLLADLRVDETVRFWHQASGRGRDGLEALSSIYDMLGLEPLAKKRVGRMSGGEQKRLSIALALMHRPAILLLDEAFTALDRQYRLALGEWLAAHCRQGGAVVHASHEVKELVAQSDEMLVLREGTVVFYGSSSSFPSDNPTLDNLLNAGTAQNTAQTR